MGGKNTLIFIYLEYYDIGIAFLKWGGEVDFVAIYFILLQFKRGIPKKNEQSHLKKPTF